MIKPLVWVRWRDAAMQEKEDSYTEDELNGPAEFEDAGFLIQGYGDKDYISIGREWDQEHGVWREGVLHIPKAYILEMKVFRGENDGDEIIKSGEA